MRKLLARTLTRIRNRQARSYRQSVLAKMDVDLAFKEICTYARTNVPYYLDKQPEHTVLTKEILRSRLEDLLDENFKLENCELKYSGGSTGAPVPFVHSKELGLAVSASLEEYYQEIGIEWSTSTKLILWGSVKDLEMKFKGLRGFLAHHVLRSHWINCFHVSDDILKSWVDQINSQKPDIIVGYTNALHELSQFVLNKKISLHSPKIISARANVLSEATRKSIQAAFGTEQVLNFYGSREVPMIAAEFLPDGKLYVFEKLNRVEVRNKLIFVTSLHNRIMPIIRFQIGDESEGLDRDERGLYLKGVVGRSYDYFLRKDGEKVHVQIFLNAMYGIKTLITFQIIQNDFARFKLFYVSVGGPIANFDQLHEELVRHFGVETKLEIIKVDEVSKLPSGKHAYAMRKFENTKEC